MRATLTTHVKARALELCQDLTRTEGHRQVSRWWKRRTTMAAVLARCWLSFRRSTVRRALARHASLRRALRLALSHPTRVYGRRTNPRGSPGHLLARKRYRSSYPQVYGENAACQAQTDETQ